MRLDILFLDIDGVLNSDKANHRYIFAPECVSQLRRILDTGVDTHVVFSTTWRIGFPFFALGWLWHQHELPLQKVIGRTPDFGVDRRGDEIRQWIENAALISPKHQIRRFAVLDDEVGPILRTIPRQSVFACDPYHGLTEEIADKIIRHFSA